jgi:serine/threonine protein kinase
MMLASSMALLPGVRVGPYEIVAALGSGGMGEVYRARDSRLGREVAIKVLPTSFAGDAERRARFEREAHAVASLSHPNVIAIFDTGGHDGEMYLVMDLLAGKTLRERLSDGPLTVRKAVDVGVQIARGLGAAHGKGIIHRDLKPENIFLLDDGQVKLLDFGLARQAMAGDHAGQTVAETDPGTVMGTMGYMAPEQVRGQTVDGRADLFAFGAVLYEMVGGQRAFQRDTAADTMTAILTQDPPELVGSRPDLSPALDRIIRHCLEKNPNERFQSARDVAFALEALSGSAPAHAADPARVVPPARRWRVPAIAAGVAMLALPAGMAIERGRQPAPTRIEFEARTWASQSITNARFGPDGETLFFSATTDTTVPSLYTVPPGAVTPQLVGGPGTQLLAVSSKGELAVMTNARLLHHRIFEGTVSRMTRDGAARPWLEHVSELDYGPDGVSAAIVHLVNGRWQIEYPIGTPIYVAQSGYPSDLRVSPDGTRVAFMDHPLSGDDRGTVKVVDGSKRVTALMRDEYWGEEGLAWSRDGRSVLFAPAYSNAQFDITAVNVDGRPVLRQVAAGPGTAAVMDTAADGRLLLVRGEMRFSIRVLVPGETGEHDASWLDFPLTPSLSRDGRHMAFADLSQSAGSDYAVAVRDMTTEKVVRLGPGAALGISPDARWVAAQLPSTLKLFLYPTGTGDPVLLDPRIDVSARRVHWFSDSTRVIYCGRKDSPTPRCYIADVKSGSTKALVPEDIVDAIPASDDRTLIIRRTTGAVQTMTLGGGAPVETKGFGADDELLAWTPDGSGVIVRKLAGVPVPIERVDPVSGTRTRIKELGPADRIGVQQTDSVDWMPDGRGYAYAFARQLSQIFVLRGAR